MPGLPARGRDRGMAPWTTNAKPHDNRGASQNRHVSVASFRCLPQRVPGNGYRLLGSHVVNVIYRVPPLCDWLQHRRYLAVRTRESIRLRALTRENRYSRLTPLSASTDPQAASLQPQTTPGWKEFQAGRPRPERRRSPKMDRCSATLASTPRVRSFSVLCWALRESVTSESSTPALAAGPSGCRTSGRRPRRHRR